ncbi:hypothetical protein [Nocardioides marmoriginsengisoli]|uniref:hypothetical protein n=1 Tax=Nocardioides marmoriginsengisoli TaxID=661483 RepID=UPI0011CD9CD9|nr:hypothetical protein [Nocardioides marmoriginsengisoli]
MIALLAAALVLAVVQRGRTDFADSAGPRKSVVTNVESLLSYNSATLKGELATEKRYLTGSFAEEYVTLVQDKIAPAAEAASVKTTSEVKASGVESLSNDRMVLVLFVTTTTLSDELAEPKVAGSRLRVTALKVDGAWLISGLKPI